MKICLFAHTIPRFPGDTAAPFMETLAESLSDLGHKVFVLVPFDKEIKMGIRRPYKLVVYKYIFPDNLHILGYGRTLTDDREMKPLFYILSPFLYIFGFLALLKLVRKEKIDIISSHWILPGGFITACASLLTKIPFTTTIPGSDIYMAGKNPFFSWMAGFAAMNAKYVMSDSSHFLGKLYKLGYHPEKTKIIRYGVNTKNFKPRKKDRALLKKLGLTENNQVVMGVGRLVSKKGFRYLIDAYPRVLSEFPSCRLVVVGDGDQKAELEGRVRDLDIQKKVVFTGTVPFNELQNYYNLADVLVSPSIKDAKGNIDASPVSMMEAMACGVPVVATKFSGSENLVVNGKTGYLISPRSSKEIASSVVKVLRSRKGSIKVKVRRIIQNKFSGKKVAKRYEQVFKEIV